MNKQLVSDNYNKMIQCFKMLQSIANVGYWELDLDTNIVWASDDTFRIFGYNHSEANLPLEMAQQHFSDETRQKLDDGFKKLLEYGCSEAELRIKRVVDSETRYIHMKSVLETDKDGNPKKIAGIVQDITERKAMETKLSDREELFRTIFEESPIGITFGTPYGDIKDANKAFCDMVGRSKEELLQLKWNDITHPDDIPIEAENFNEFLKGKMKKYNFFKRYIKPDGTHVVVHMRVSHVMVQSDPDISHVCIVEDVSQKIKTELDLQESERSKSVLLSNLPGMAYRCRVDSNRTMRFVSDGCYSLTGYKPQSLIDNREKSYIQLICPDYRENILNKIDKAVKSGNVYSLEYPITDVNGDIKWVFDQGRGIHDHKGTLYAVEGLIIDITERKRHEDEIKYLGNHDFMTGLYNRRFFEEEKERLDAQCYLPLSVIYADVNGVKLINDAFGHSQGDMLIVQCADIIRACCSEKDIIARMGGDEFSILLPNTDYKSALIIVENIKDKCYEYNKKSESESNYITISLGLCTKQSVEEDLDLVIRTAEDKMYKHKLLNHKSSRSVIMQSVKATMFERSQETEAHAGRLIELSNSIGRELGLSQMELDDLTLLCTLHDIGKIGIDSSILNKPSKLNIEEWFMMKRHPEIGYRIAMALPELRPVAEYILCHHEWWNGQGYPQGLKAKEIPLLSRILAVVDAYDAMTHDRIYRKSVSKEAALNELLSNAGIMFDPGIVSIFKKCISKDM